LFVPGGGETPRRFADDGLQVVAPLIERDARAAVIAELSRGSFVAAAPAAAALAGR
jgi:hypothetical protein